MNTYCVAVTVNAGPKTTGGVTTWDVEMQVKAATAEAAAAQVVDWHLAQFGGTCTVTGVRAGTLAG